MEYILDERLPKIGKIKNSSKVTYDNGEENLQEYQKKVIVHLVSEKKAASVLERIHITYDNEIRLDQISFNKAEAEQDFYYGNLAIPRFADVMGKRLLICFFVNGQDIILVNDDGYAKEIISRLRKKHIRQNETREKFLSMFLSEIIAGDAVFLDEYEQRLMKMEEDALHGETEDFNEKMLTIRKHLLTLRSYYDQFVEIGRVLEENENMVFQDSEVKFFGTFSARSYRLLKRTIHLIDYANQVKDVYQSIIDDEQNRNMQYLTVVSTIFFPLTVITGWYGMNFENMPELSRGYPYVIAVSIIVIIVCILLFKKKKIF